MSQSPSKITISKNYLRGWVQLLTLVREYGLSLSGREANCCFLNTGQTRFANIAAVSGLDFIDDARGCAVVDWDKDGDLDVWLSNRTAPQTRFMRNDVPNKGNFVAFHLTGTKSNRDAIGARVSLTLEGDPNRHIKTLRAGEGFLSQSSKWIHFGVGAHTSIAKVQIRWPDGSVNEFSDLAAGRFYQLVQGDSDLATVQFDEQRRDLTPTDLHPKSFDTLRTVVAPREMALGLRLVDAKGDEFTLRKTVTGPVLVNLWSETCVPCIKELEEFSHTRQQFSDAGLRVITLRAPDPRESSEQAVKQLNELGKKLNIPFELAAATEASMEQLTKAQDEVTQIDQPVGLPTSFLLDAEGRLSVLYRGRVTPEQLLEDVKRLGLPDEKWNTVSVPFAGKWFESPFGDQ